MQKEEENNSGLFYFRAFPQKRSLGVGKTENFPQHDRVFQRRNELFVS
jgi:hypothetical protein